MYRMARSIVLIPLTALSFIYVTKHLPTTLLDTYINSVFIIHLRLFHLGNLLCFCPKDHLHEIVFISNVDNNHMFTAAVISRTGLKVPFSKFSGITLVSAYNKLDDLRFGIILYCLQVVSNP